MFTVSESQRSGLIILHLSLGTTHCSLPYYVLQEGCICKFLIFSLLLSVTVLGLVNIRRVEGGKRVEGIIPSFCLFLDVMSSGYLLSEA